MILQAIISGIFFILAVDPGSKIPLSTVFWTPNLDKAEVRGYLRSFQGAHILESNAEIKLRKQSRGAPFKGSHIAPTQSPYGV